MKFLLASTSPRRKELLKNIIAEFEIASPHFDENQIKIKNPKKKIEKIAEGKAKAVFSKAQGDWCIIGADTMVVLNNNQTIGKPKSKEDAKKILKNLSGKSHRVMTGVCIMIRQNDIETKISFVSTTKVFFSELTNTEIEEYVSTEEPNDKAGAYAIQGLASKFIEKIDGSFHNIVGLPLSEIYKALKNEKLI